MQGQSANYKRLYLAYIPRIINVYLSTYFNCMIYANMIMLLKFTGQQIDKHTDPGEGSKIRYRLIQFDHLPVHTLSISSALLQSHN